MMSNYLKGTGVLYSKSNKQINHHKETMENTVKEIEELKKLIHTELQHCNRFLWPKECEMQTTEHGLAKLEETIIRYVANEGMGIGSAIVLIEAELGHTY